MKLVGGDSGRYERHTFVEDVLLSPSERAIIDVLFETAGAFTIAHNTPTQSYILGAIHVTDEPIDESLLAQFDELRTCPDLTAERVRIDAQRDRAPDKTLAFESLMPLLYGDPSATADARTCPMHPDVMSAEQGTCPECGMKLIAASPSAWTCPMHPEVVSAKSGICPECGMKLIAAASSALPVVGHAETHPHDTPDGLEWEDLMPDINRATDSCNMIWKLVDHDTGQANWEIDGAFTVGDQFSSSAVLAGALLAGERVVRVGRRLLAVGQLTRLSAIGLSVGTLAALAIAHTPGGLFGFRETGLRPAPQTLVVITIETLATILLTVAIHQAHRAVRSEDATEDLEHPRRHVAEAA